MIKIIGRVGLVAWDHDNTVAQGFGTSHLARYRRDSPAPYLNEFVRRGWFDSGQMHTWTESNRRGVQTIGDLADMLTDFFYSMKRGDGRSVITKEQVIQGKNYLLKGVTVGEVWDVAENHIPFMKGAREAIERFKATGLKQTSFSETLDLLIKRRIEKYGLDGGGGVPAMLEIGVGGNSRVISSEDVGSIPERELVGARLTGEVREYDKWGAFFRYLDRNSIELDCVAVVDDSAANIAPMKHIQDAGGLAIGFNPTEAHLPRFVDAGIPVLKQEEPDMGPFVNIVLAEPEERENAIGKYCTVK